MRVDSLGIGTRSKSILSVWCFSAKLRRCAADGREMKGVLLPESIVLSHFHITTIRDRHCDGPFIANEALLMLGNKGEASSSVVE